MKRILMALATVGTVALSGLPAAAAPEASGVVKTYGDIAQAMYGDSLTRAKALKTAVDTLVATPSDAALKAARRAWLSARVPYQQTEAFRFGNAIVDDWEGKVNAWPLDEGLIDYVDASYGQDSEENPLYTANVIANARITHGGEEIDATTITKELLAEKLQEIGGVEANVATGYHAIEFLLWGQDLNGTGPGAGNRPWTDYAKGSACTNGNCDRRGQYLSVATELLIDDLEEMAGNWEADGEARKALAEAGNDGALSAMLTGLGSLSYGELAGERMKLGLLLNDPEEEHDCFSDNTHNSHYYDIVGMRAIYFASYTRTDGKTVVNGPSLHDLVRAKDPALAAEMKQKLDATVAAAQKMKQRAETVEAYDQMLGAGNAEGNATLEAVIAALTEQTRSIERIVASLALEPIAFEGSDSLDNPAAIFQ
ncbi:MAG: peptidase [Alphaproteobacteria bacterium]|nr:peptidase [Alphaproteobacteria bacterium]MBU0798207.1 peptidase [Alphaproteobacteria bacterium]MBU0887575.1 peptidase [Alphaproteobacteria bacterium]MBU1814226.1 peptidase [Alphaproteobacteria bacterium]MBU2090012.1 peptidase [Alphaproteobacteria bacterium]